jgi:hypothetical protein
LRQRTVGHPIGCHQEQHQQNRYAQVDVLQNSSVRHLEDSTVPRR